MAEVARFQGDVVLVGGLYGMTVLDYPAGSIVDADVAANANLAGTKLQKNLAKHVFQAGSAVDATLIVHAVKGTTGTLKHFSCANVTACTGASTVTVDLQKNGVTCLSAPVELDIDTGDLGTEIGILTVSSLAAGDVLTIVIDATLAYGTDALAAGVYAQVDFVEDYAS